MKNSSLAYLFLSLPRHDEKYTSTPWQLATELTTHKSVFFVDHPYTFIEALMGLKNPSIRKRMMSYVGRKYLRKDHVTVILSPFIFPVNFLPAGSLYRYLVEVNQRLVSKRINRVLGSFKVEKIVFVNSFDFYLPTLHKLLAFKPVLSVYHCIDPMVKQYTLKHGRALQSIAAKSSDLIITTSPSLKKEFERDDFPISYYVPNAANFSLFAKAQLPQLSVHPRLSKINGPVIGYLGNIERRIDVSLLMDVIEQLPDWNLIMAGPIDPTYLSSELFNHPRIFFPGSFPHNEAPSVIKRFDVSIIPFKCDEVSSGIYPLKLFEYLAAGKPVVTTNFNPEVLLELKNDIHIAQSSIDFKRLIVEAATTNTPQKILQRTELAWDNSWQERVVQFEKVIQDHLV